MAVTIEKSVPHVYVRATVGSRDTGHVISTSASDRLEIYSGGAVKLFMSHEQALLLAVELERAVTTWRTEFSKWHRTE